MKKLHWNERLQNLPEKMADDLHEKAVAALFLRDERIDRRKVYK